MISLSESKQIIEKESILQIKESNISEIIQSN